MNAEDDNNAPLIAESKKMIRAELNRMGITRIRDAVTEHEGRNYPGLSYDDGTGWESFFWFPPDEDDDIPEKISVKNIVFHKETLEFRVSELVKEINQRKEEGLEYYDLNRQLFYADKVTDCLKRFLNDSSADIAIDMFFAGIDYAKFKSLPHGEAVRKFHREGNKRPKADLPDWKKRLWEFLETQEEKPSPRRVINLCEHFSLAGKKVSEGVKCYGETIIYATFRQALGRFWNEK